MAVGYSPQTEVGLAKVQKQFDHFNDTIKLKRFEESKTLREKRDIIRRKLDERLPGVFKKYGETCLTYHYYDQGSYEMGTGTEPLDGDFDIDQGMYFEVGTDIYPDPVVLKQRVHEALDGHTDKVCLRRPCVTVFYHRDGESIYHVDIAIYSHRNHNSQGKDLLARGKERSAPEHRVWDVSDPQGLTAEIERTFTGDDRAQFRRVVRALKRWKNINFAGAGNAAPRGIALTVAAYHDLTPTYADPLSGKPDDLGALHQLVSAMLTRFHTAYNWETGEWARRIEIKLPVEPYSDLSARMTDKHMEEFENKLKTLQEALDAADAEVDPVEACKKLQKVFGHDFPVPDPEDTGKRHGPAIVSSSSSA